MTLTNSIKTTRYLFTLGLGLLFIALLVNGSMHGADFKVFYLAGERLLQHLPIYQISDGWSPFKYHPAWALVFSFWARLPFAASIVFFNALNIFFWLAGAKRWANWLGYSFSPRNIFILFLLGLNAMSSEVAYGQLNGFLFWSCTQIFHWLEEDTDQSFKSGFLLAILISLKLNFAVLAFYIFTKNWRSIRGAAAGVIFLHLMLIPVFGEWLNLDLYKSWLQLLLSQSFEQINTFEVQGILRFCYQAFSQAAAQKAWLILLAASIAYGVYLHSIYFKSQNFSKNQRLSYNASYWLGVVFFFSPLAWWYQTLFLYPTIFLLLKVSLPKRWHLLVCLSLICFSLVSYNTIGHYGINQFKQYMGYFGFSVLLFAIYLNVLIRRKKLLAILPAANLTNVEAA